MDEMTGQENGRPSLGRRVAYWRSRRGMSQQVFADRLGKSKSWVGKVERGVRRLDKFSTLREIAEVLRVETRLLLDEVPQRQAGSPSSAVDPATVAAIRTALTRYGGWGQRPRNVPTVDKLGQAVTHAWMSLARADYDRLLRGLPALITDGQWVRAERRGDQAAALLLGQTYQITADLLRRVGEHHLGWLAADRGLVVSADSDDPLWAARAAIPLAEVARAAGRPRHAAELAMSMIRRVAPPEPVDDNGGSVDRRRVIGALLLQAALSAATATDQTTTTALLDRAASIADQVGDTADPYRTSFGPVLVDIARLAAAIELGHGRRILDRIDELATRPDYQRLPAAVRAAHLIDVARAHLQAGNPPAAGLALLDAAYTAPEEIRARPAARMTLAAVLRRHDRPGPIAQLADTMGVTG